MVGAGDMDQRVTLQTYTFTSDGAGGQTRELANVPSVPTVWAKVQPVRGAERFQEERTVAVGTYLFTIRYRTDISEGDVIMWRSEPYNIRTVKRTSGRMLNLVIEAERWVSV